MIVSLIAARSSNGVIGRDNGLPWHIPQDLKYFRDVTRGHPVVMGRKTYDSIGKPLPNRENWVLSRSPDRSDTRVKWISSLEEFFSAYRSSDQEVFVLGGGEVYRMAMAHADRLYITEVYQQIEGDTLFPEFDRELFKEKSRVDHMESDPAFSFLVFEKR